jgi:hypothetical protein
MQVVAISSAVPYYRRAHLACRSLGSQYKSFSRASLVHCFEHHLSMCMSTVCHGALPNRRLRSPTNRHRVSQAFANTGTLLVTARLTLNPLTWKILWAPNNASRWMMGFNLAFKGLIMPERSNGRKWPYAQPSSLHCVPSERTKWLLNVCIFKWKRETNIYGALALVYFVHTVRSLQKLNYWKTNFPRDFENITKPTL